MINSMHFHHIGYAVRDISKTAAFYLSAGWTMSDMQLDKIQGTYIAFLTKDEEPMIELVAPYNEHSPITKTLDKMGVTTYHVCYSVADLDIAIMEMRKMRYMPLFTPVPAIAIDNKRICYMMHPEVGLIELVEE